MVAVEDRLHAALAVLRVVVTVNMLAMAAWRWDNHVRPTATLVVLAGLTAWTLLVLYAYRTPLRRTAWLLVADLAVAVSALAVTPWLKGEGFRATVPGYWVMGALLVWAIHWHWRGGLLAGAALALTDVVVRDHLTQTNYGHVFLLLLGGCVVGYLCQSLQQMAAERARAERETAAAQERARLSRAVHDGVLQVLSLVQRAGRDAPAVADPAGVLATLGTLAAEQESRLRSLIRAQDSVQPSAPPQTTGTTGTTWTSGTSGAPVDLSAALETLASTTVTVVTPGAEVPMPASRAVELVAAVAACLDNVRMHVGLTAPAWVFLEQVGDQVTVSVRDEGPGIAPARLAEAERQGRLGVASSIRGRIEELGGSCVLSTGSGGTEWELSVPMTSQPSERSSERTSASPSPAGPAATTAETPAAGAVRR